MAWTSSLELDAARRVVAGSAAALVASIGRGADLRIGTEFRHNEHIDVSSPNPERIEEVAEFGVTYVVDGRWVAGIMSLRQPIELPDGFGPRPSMSFFLYNQDGQQGIARPHLDGRPATGTRGPSAPMPEPGMPKYHAQDNWDKGTNAPCHNFVYDFGVFRYLTDDSWREVLAHDADGRVVRGSLADLTTAFAAGAAVKVAVDGLCDDLAAPGADAPAHEVFVQAGSAYYYTERKLFMVGTHPVVRVRAAVPLLYASGNWDFGWIMARTDGHVVYRRCDPHSLAFTDHPLHRPVRWFVR